MALALIMLMGAFIKLCSMHTPTNNPNMPKHKEFPGKSDFFKKKKSAEKKFCFMKILKIQEWPLFWPMSVFHHGVERSFGLKNL